MLPGRDGLEILAARRGVGDATPVLILTARDTVLDRVAGLDAGADDYLVKPFAFAELLARVRALLRRGRPDAPAAARGGGPRDRPRRRGGRREPGDHAAADRAASSRCSSTSSATRARSCRGSRSPAMSGASRREAHRSTTSSTSTSCACAGRWTPRVRRAADPHGARRRLRRPGGRAMTLAAKRPRPAGVLARPRAAGRRRCLCRGGACSRCSDDLYEALDGQLEGDYALAVQWLRQGRPALRPAGGAADSAARESERRPDVPWVDAWSPDGRRLFDARAGSPRLPSPPGPPSVWPRPPSSLTAGGGNACADCWFEPASVGRAAHLCAGRPQRAVRTPGARRVRRRARASACRLHLPSRWRPATCWPAARSRRSRR